MRPLMYGLLALVGFAAALTPASDGDIWWHLAAGREIVRNAAVPVVDAFSVGAAGRAWIDVHWLFQVLVHGGYQLGGLLALVMGKALVVAIGAAVLLAAVERGAEADATRATAPAATGATVQASVDASAVRRAATLVFVPLLLLALLAVRPLLLLRPVVVTLLFLALFTWVIERYRAGGRARFLWLLPAMQIVWVNCQGLSALGPALIVCHAAGAAIAARWGRAELPAGGPRRLLLAGVACLAAAFITPYGLRGFVFPLRLLMRIAPGSGNVFSANIAENVPPFVLARSSPGELVHLPWFLALVAVSFVVARRQLVLGRCLAAASFLGLALLATRNVLLAYWIVTPIVALNLALNVAPRLARPARVARFLAPAFALALLGIGALTVTSLRRETALSAPAPFRVPADSAGVIAARGGHGAVFAADHYGGYVIWALFPNFRPFIDTRLILRTAAEYEEFLGALAEPRRFDDLHSRHQFSYVLVPSAFPDRYLGLIQHLYSASEWKLLHTDGTETLFVHDPVGVEAGIDLRSREVTTRILESLDGRYAAGAADQPVLRAARLHLGRLQLALGHLDEAKYVVSRAPVSDVEAQSLLALAHLLDGDVGSAERVARAAAEADPKAVAPLTLLARAALKRGDRSSGVAWLRRALAIDPYDADAQAILAHLEAEGRPPDGAPPP